MRSRSSGRSIHGRRTTRVDWGTWAIRALILLLAPAFLASASYAEVASEYNAQGVEYYKVEDWDRAIDHFLRAYELAPENMTVRRNLCNAYQALANDLAKVADFDSASELLINAMSVDPENAAPLVQLGSYYVRLQMNEEAIFRLEESIELEPDNVDAHELLGDAYDKTNNLPKALEHWEWVREVAPNREGIDEKLEKAYREEKVEYNFNKRASAHFHISYGRDTTGGDLSAVLTTLESAYRQVGRMFGGVYPPTPIQVVVYTADNFARSTLLGEHVGAVYDGKIKIPIKDKDNNSISLDELKRRLFHEYTHVVVRFWAADNVPWWLNEGLAETFSGELAEQDSLYLNEANSAGALFRLADLEDSQLPKLEVEELRLAYLQAHATVDFLWSKYGYRSLGAMMTNLSEGMETSDALVHAYRLNYRLLENNVANNMRKRRR